MKRYGWQVQDVSNIQVWLNERQTEELKKMREFFDDLQDKAMNGKAYQYTGRGKHRHMTKRKGVNNSYVVREALSLLMTEIESILNPLKKTMSPEEIRKHEWFPKKVEIEPVMFPNEFETQLQPQKPQENKQPWKTDSRLNSWGRTIDRRRREWRAPTDPRRARLARKY